MLSRCDGDVTLTPISGVDLGEERKAEWRNGLICSKSGRRGSKLGDNWFYTRSSLSDDLNIVVQVTRRVMVTPSLRPNDDLFEIEQVTPNGQ